MFRLGILTISDAGSAGRREDTSGQAIRTKAMAVGFEVVFYDILPDDRRSIESKLIEWCDGGDIDLILTTGGTGLSPRDCTPEATNSVIDRSVPGISEAIRHSGLEHTQFSMLSRGVSGLRGRCLIVNLPGSTAAVNESLETISDVLPHALEIITKEQVEVHRTT